MRYTYDTVGEAVLNPDFYGWAAGRIEIWDSENESGYPFDEIRYFVRPKRRMCLGTSGITSRVSGQSFWVIRFLTGIMF